MFHADIVMLRTVPVLLNFVDNVRDLISDEIVLEPARPAGQSGRPDLISDHS